MSRLILVAGLNKPARKRSREKFSRQFLMSRRWNQCDECRGSFLAEYIIQVEGAPSGPQLCKDCFAKREEALVEAPRPTVCHRCKDCGIAFHFSPNTSEPVAPTLCYTCSMKEKIDLVNQPPHYTKGTFEVIDVIEDWNLGYHLSNVIKYIARSPHKGSEVQDLKKARWYLDRKIERLEK